MHRIIEAEANEVGGEPVTFDLGGRTFTRRPDIAFGALLAIADIGSMRSNLERAQALASFVESWLVDEDRDAWRAAVKRLPTFAPLDEIADYLIGSIAPVPTPARSSSAAKRSNAGTSTRGVGRGSRPSR